MQTIFKLDITMHILIMQVFVGFNFNVQFLMNYIFLIGCSRLQMKPITTIELTLICMFHSDRLMLTFNNMLYTASVRTNMHVILYYVLCHNQKNVRDCQTIYMKMKLK